MGGASSKSVDGAVQIAKSTVSYSPPLGPPNSSNPIVFLDIALGRYGDATKLGRILIELKADVVPKTADNFKQLCTKEPGQVLNLAASLTTRLILARLAVGT